jgi:tetratricopeptide (TPR) repeat protein
MPAHIFSRLGMWDEAIQSCHDAVDASVAAAKRFPIAANHWDFHSLSWLVEMPFELGHAKEAEASLKTWGAAIETGVDHTSRGLYAAEVASFMARSGQWSRVDELLAPLAKPAQQEPGTGGTTCGSGGLAPDAALAKLGEIATAADARALAAAMQRDASAEARIKELEQAYADLETAMKTSQPGSAVDTLVAGHKRHVDILRARAKGDGRAVVKLLRAAAADTAAIETGESNPTAFVLDDMLGDALLAIGDAKGAGEAYARALAEHPGRAHSLLGLARAATKRRDKAAARDAYGKLAELWKTADAGIDGLDEARAASK